MSFVTFSDEFIATKFPGYFFNIKDELLYSMKISGVLKPLKFYTPNRFNHMWRHSIKLKDGSKVTTKGGYYVSFHGTRKFYPIERLKELEHVDSVIPVASKTDTL